MSYATVAEADAVLGHLASWTALTDAVKQQHLDVGMLWLNVTYEWPGSPPACFAASDVPVTAFPYVLPMVLTATQQAAALAPAWPRTGACDCNGCSLTGVPLAVKRAEIVAAGYSARMPLFTVPSTEQAGQGALTKRRKKVDTLEIEEQWSTTGGTVDTGKGPLGQLVIPEVDAWLHCIAPRAGTRASVPAIFCV